MHEDLRERLARLSSRSTLRLTHYGRKTGNPHKVTIWFLVDDATVYLVTMDMKRQWTRNVQVRSEVILRIGEESFTGQVELIRDPVEMSHVVELMKKKYLISRVYVWFKGGPDGAFKVRLTT